MTTEKLYVIREKKYNNYWNNESGFVSLLTADIFHSKQYMLPVGGKWQKLSDAIIEISNYYDYEDREV